MLRYIAGILTALLFIGSVFGLLYIFDQYDYIDLKPSVLISLSTIPGWEEVADAYKLGLENKNFLEERQQELAEREKEMEAEKQTLAELALALQEKEDYLEIERRKTLNELSRVGNNQAPAVN
ncbi:MAG TPA: hypothetical protein DEB05_09260, partial [Firmicutes bacterium]|nr:hypothetical protein [Bacillota bacterium]